ncbi:MULTISPECIES: metal-sensitive transcriptional regulator [Kosmotoga]|uniref:Transcriptional regulator n=1 Tax=Kosmotoga olearia (strain ATCC BAA-1733 / DSM 21960 / TBF 19.5.1) TaxID=521045 RepID=C5CDU1_KOSOT|nr:MULTISPECIES: metal-sensitive transcriptional regulator [Kosmotoga]ACR79110.1 protein of unknown function DUF156 [Kosmotoga olearia TBF 19.5.1]
MNENISKDDLIKRLRRIEGQIRGLQRMIEEDRNCPDIMTQVSAVMSALSKVSEMIAKGYAHQCLMEISEKKDIAELDNLIETLLKFRRL